VRVRCDGRAASSGAAAEVERLLSAPKCGLASGLVAIAKFVCDTVCYCSCRVHTKRETQERLVEKDFSFFISFSWKISLFYFIFLYRKRWKGLNVPLVLKLAVVTTFFRKEKLFITH
jgi:hypothetical protein